VAAAVELLRCSQSGLATDTHLRVYLRVVREQIISDIRKLAAANGGQPPGFRRFESETGIRETEWRGVYWARWSDAVAEAGLQPNPRNPKHDANDLLRKFADACRHFGKMPTAMELRLHGRANPDFPNHKAIYRHFQSTANMLRELAEWTKNHADYADVAKMLAEHVSEAEQDTKRPAEGFVYLIRWGAHYKIGRGDQLERRVKQVKTGLPDSGTLVHAIRTDDPPGIEAYWHRRFADRRAKNGEWFKLSTSDIAAFKRRKFQ
jgi:hypothetical protein